MSLDLTVERLNRGYSIKSLAGHLGIHEHAIRRLEAGGTIHPASAKKIADFFGCKVTDIMPLSARGGDPEVDAA